MLFCVILYGKRDQSCFYVIKNLFRMNSLVEILSERGWSWCWWRCESGITKLFSLSGLMVQKVITFQHDHVGLPSTVVRLLCPQEKQKDDNLEKLFLFIINVNQIIQIWH